MHSKLGTAAVSGALRKSAVIGVTLSQADNGRITRAWTYSNGTEPAEGGGAVPPGLELTSTDGRGKRTTYGYDARGDLRVMTDPAGLVTRTDYDEIGRRTAETVNDDTADPDVRTSTTTWAYDQHSNLREVTGTPIRNKVSDVVHQARTTRGFDLNDNLMTMTAVDLTGGDAARTTSHTYDDADRERQTVEPGGGMLSRTYDKAGNVETTTDQLGRTYWQAYDPRNLLTSVTLLGFVQDPVAPSVPRDLTLLSRSYDDAGRQVSETDALGRQVITAYDGADRIRSQTQPGYDDLSGATRTVTLNATEYDKAGNPRVVTSGGPRNPLVVSTTYDNAGWQVTSTTDPAALARTTTWVRDRNGNPTVTTLSAAGSARQEQTRTTYDDASRPFETSVENGATDLTTRVGYDERGNAISTTDPRGTAAGAEAAAFTSTVSYDQAGRPRRTTSPPVTVDDGASDTPAITDPASRLRLTATTGFDTWGNPTDTRDARGNTTRTSYDGLDRKTQVTHPGYNRGGTTLTPTETFGYDSAGNLLAQTSRRGFTTDWTYDALNRAVRQLEPAATPGAPRASSRSVYDDTGNLIETVDATGAVTRTGYDDRNRPRTATQLVRDPDGAGPATAGSFTKLTDYDDQGHVVLNRGASVYADRTDNPATPVDERYAVTRTTRNAAGEATAVTDPTGASTQTRYDLAGRAVSSTDPLGRRTDTDYDLAGRATAVRRYAPDGDLLTTSSSGHDLAGNVVSTTSPRGNTSGATAERFTRTSAFDALNRLVGTATPTSANAALDITTGYGYDAAGNNTRVIDGNGNSTRTTYQNWNLPDSTVEPTTTAHPSPADRTWSFDYDDGGLVRTETQPGAVTVSRDYDALGRLLTELGSGPDAPAASRSFGYDLLGRTTSLSHPRSPVALSYDDRGLLTATTGGAGSSSFGYDPDGRRTARTDAAGTASYTYTPRDELRTAADSLSGITRTWQHDPAGQPQQMTSSAGLTREYTYDDLARLSTDRQSAADGGLRVSQSYGYDPDGNLTSQSVDYPLPPLVDPATFDPVTAPAELVTEAAASINLAEGTHAYCYDHAGRLTRWDRPINSLLEGELGKAVPQLDLDDNDGDACGGAPDGVDDLLDVTDYAYDGAGNRTQAGLKNYGYDERNRLITGPLGGYSYTPRGTMLASTDGPDSRTYTFDGLGRQSQAGTTRYDYDALDRVATRTLGDDPVTPGTPAGELLSSELAYAGTEIDPADDHTNDQLIDGVTVPLGAQYARGPAGELLALSQNGGPALQTTLNRHGDLTALTTGAGRLSDTRIYDPFGQVALLARTGLTNPAVGFQGDWTDSTTGQVWMGARWYQPSNASFTRRDTVRGELSTPVSLNRYTYGHNNPLGYIDPDGQRVTSTDEPTREYAEDRAISLEQAGGGSTAQQTKAFYRSRLRQAAKDPDFLIKRALREATPLYGVLENLRARSLPGHSAPAWSASVELSQLIVEAAKRDRQFFWENGENLEGFVLNVLTDAKLTPDQQRAWGVANGLATKIGRDIATAELLREAGPYDFSIRRTAEAASFIPFIGAPASFGLGVADIAQGNYGSGLLELAGVVPFVKPARTAVDVGVGITNKVRRTNRATNEITDRAPTRAPAARPEATAQPVKTPPKPAAEAGAPTVSFSRSRAPGIARTFDDATAKALPPSSIELAVPHAMPTDVRRCAASPLRLLVSRWTSTPLLAPPREGAER